MRKPDVCGQYGNYVLVPCDGENADKYFDACLEAVCPDEIAEAWQLYRCSLADILKKARSAALQGRGYMYFLVYRGEEGEQAVGMGGINPLGDTAGTVSEIWFAGEKLGSHSRFVVKYAKEILRRFLEYSPVLVNAAGSWNYPTLKLVRYLGFSVEEKNTELGPNRALFKRFYLVK